MPINEYGQQTTDSGHVITESERIGNSIRDIYYHTMKAPIFPPLNKALTAYVIDYAHTEWSKNVRHGVALGRSDAVAMLRSVLKPSTIDVPASEIRKIISGLTTEATQDGKEEQ